MPTKTNRIALYRLRDPKRPNHLELFNAGYELISESNEQKLFVKFAHQSIPTWRTFISEQLAQSRRDVYNSSSSFILLHYHANNGYAVTGGYGYLQIEKFAEKDFGIEVAKRLIGKDKISGLSQRIPRGELRQVLRTFTDYNPARDRDNLLRILQSIFGRGSFEGRSSRIEGKAAIILRTAGRASDLQNVIEAVEEVLLREPALHFVQQFDIVNDIDLSTTLTATLQKQVVQFWSNKETRDNFYVEFDDSLQQFRTTVFKIGLGRASIEVDDFDLDVIRDQLLASGIRINSEADLLRLRVTGFGEDGNVTINRSALWDHLIGELRVGNGDYLRFRGQWLCLLDQFRKVMTERISEIPVLSGELPVWDRAVLTTELEYNQYVAKQKNWHCFDREFVQVGGYSRLRTLRHLRSASEALHSRERNLG